MSTRLAATLAVLGAAALTGAAPALAMTSGDGGGPAPSSPTDAQALIDGAASTGGAPLATPVDPAAALDAASTPGADTYVESDLSLDEAVGLTDDATAAQKRCWSSTSWGSWGIWPYNQKVIQTSYWCAVYGVKVTYETSTTTASGTLCGVSWRNLQELAGGVGTPFFTVRASVGFSCPTDIPWVSLHPNRHIDVRHDDRGTVVIVAEG